MKYLIGIAIGIALILWFPEFLPWVKGSVCLVLQFALPPFSSPLSSLRGAAPSPSPGTRGSAPAPPRR